MQEMKKEIENLKKKKIGMKKPQSKKTTKTPNMSAARRLLNSYEKGPFIEGTGGNDRKKNHHFVKAELKQLENLSKPGAKQTFKDSLFHSILNL